MLAWVISLQAVVNRSQVVYVREVGRGPKCLPLYPIRNGAVLSSMYRRRHSFVHHSVFRYRLLYVDRLNFILFHSAAKCGSFRPCFHAHIFSTDRLSVAGGEDNLADSQAADHPDSDTVTHRASRFSVCLLACAEEETGRSLHARGVVLVSIVVSDNSCLALAKVASVFSTAFLSTAESVCEQQTANIVNWRLTHPSSATEAGTSSWP